MKKLWLFVRSSLRFRLVFLVLLAALPALSLTFFSGWEQRKHAESEAKDNALRLAQFSVSKHELLIEDTRVFIIALSHSLDLTSEDIQGCGHLFAHIQDTHFPFYSAFYVADLMGNILCSMPNGDLPEDLPTCHHYQELIASDDFVVSAYHICRNTGRGVISMGYPLFDNLGQRVGVINISMDLRLFNTFAQEIDLPPGSTLTILDKAGTILAHFPDPDTWVGKTILENSIEQQILTLKNGTIRGFGSDEVERLYAFLPLSGSEDGVFINVGIPVELAFAEVDRAMNRNLILVGSVTVLLVLAAWFLGELVVMRPIRALVHTTQQLAAGNLDFRVDTTHHPGEFGILIQSIDEMAEALSNREQERAEAEQAIRAYAADLEQSNRDLLDFANITSHDLQEPLRKIANFSDILLLRYAADLDQRAQDYLNRIQAAAKQMQSFIIALLSYSRISTKAQTSEVIDLNDTLENVLRDLDLQIEESNANIYVRDLPTVRADPIQMHQLFLNLISNSLKFRKSDTRAVIDVQGELIQNDPAETSEPKFTGGYFEVRVSDNGIGFDEKYLDRIYQPFQRLHRIDEFEGTGMGLAICRKIVERHGGEIEAHSSPGKGAIFIVRFPVNHSAGGHS